MSTPVPVSRARSSKASYGSPLGTSPASASSPFVSILSSSPQTRGVYGSSPPSSSTSVGKNTPHSAAKRWWKRLKYDTALDTASFVVGYVESVEHPERRSGAEAWSLRRHDHLVEAPYLDFAARYPEDATVPFHRIVYFRSGRELVWESDYHRRLQQEALSPSSPVPDASISRKLSSAHSAGTPSTPRSSLPQDAMDDCFFEMDACLEGEEVEAAAAQLHPSFVELPDECWHGVLRHLDVRELCVGARVCRSLRSLTSCDFLWEEKHGHLFGSSPPGDMPAAVVRRVCRRSELRATRWRDVEPVEQVLGFAGSICLQMDGSKVMSADSSAVRLWSHTTGRRIATLQGHAGRVHSVAFDDTHLLSGDNLGVVKIWGMDDLRCMRTLRGEHAAAVSCCRLIGGLPMSGSEDGTVCLWDVGQNQPVVTLEAGGAVHGMDSWKGSGFLVTAGEQVEVWDLGTVERLYSLQLWSHPEELWTTFPFTAVSHQSNWIAAGCAGGVAVWDTRSVDLVGTMKVPPRSTGKAHVGQGPVDQPYIGQTRVGDAEAGEGGGSSSSSSSGSFSDHLPACVGVQLDDWKMVVAFAGSTAVWVHDMRAMGSSGGRGQAWKEPIMVLEAPAPVTCFQFHEQKLMAGQEGAECMLWDFEAAVRGGPHSASPGWGEEGEACGEKKGRKKGNKVYNKKKDKYPKRKTK